jgi:hypothetical protein
MHAEPEPTVSAASEPEGFFDHHLVAFGVTQKHKTHGYGDALMDLDALLGGNVATPVYLYFPDH